MRTARYEIFLTAGLLYFVMTLVVARVFRWLERATGQRMGAADRGIHLARPATE